LSVELGNYGWQSRGPLGGAGTVLTADTHFGRARSFDELCVQVMHQTTVSFNQCGGTEMATDFERKRSHAMLAVRNPPT
jgi:hypothetical protein